MKEFLILLIISVMLFINSLSINAKVYTDTDLEQYKSSDSSNNEKQTEEESNEEYKIKKIKTKTKFSARGCEVVKFSQYNRTTSSKIRSKGRIIQGDNVIDEDEKVVVTKKTKKCVSFTIRNTSYSSKTSPIIKAIIANGKTIMKRISIPKLEQNKTHSDELCFEGLEFPIVKLECSF